MLYSKVNLGLKTGADAAANYEPSAGEAFVAGVKEGFETGPFKSAERLMEADHFADFAQMSDAEILSFAKEYKPEPLPMDEQARRIEEAGYKGKMNPDKTWDAETLEAMILARQEGEERRFTLDKASGLAGAAGFAGEIVGGGADPLALASMFVPVAGEARALALLGKAKGLAGRSLVRAGLGAAEGLAGAALVEPITLAAQSLGQQEYGPLQSLMNLAGGAVFGAALRPAAGLIHEAKIRDKWIKPWEVVESTQVSRDHVQANAKAMLEARLAADPSLDVEAARRESLAHSLMLDVYFRNRAAREKISLDEIYKSWQIGFASGGENLSGLQREIAGMELQGKIEAGQPGATVEPEKAVAGFDSQKAQKPQAPLQGAPGEIASWQITRPDGGIAQAGQVLAERRAVIEYFEGASPSQTGEGLVHFIAADLAEAARAPGASPALRDMWAQVEEALGIEPGSPFTKEASDKLAKEVDNYFWRGKIQNENLAPAVEEIRGLLGHAYLEAEAAGYPGNPRAAKAVARIFAGSPEDYGRNFRAAFMDLLDGAEEVPPAPLAKAAKEADPQTRLMELHEMAKAHAESLDKLEGLDAETIAELKAENAAEAQALADELACADIFEMYAACLLA